MVDILNEINNLKLILKDIKSLQNRIKKQIYLKQKEVKKYERQYANN
jgi:hypothetical protein